MPPFGSSLIGKNRHVRKRPEILLPLCTEVIAKPQSTAMSRTIHKGSSSWVETIEHVSELCGLPGGLESSVSSSSVHLLGFVSVSLEPFGKAPWRRKNVHPPMGSFAILFPGITLFSPKLEH